MEICLNSEDLRVVLCGAETEPVLVMGYHPQRQRGIVQAVKI